MRSAMLSYSKEAKTGVRVDFHERKGGEVTRFPVRKQGSESNFLFAMRKRARRQ